MILLLLFFIHHFPSPRIYINKTPDAPDKLCPDKGEGIMFIRSVKLKRPRLWLLIAAAAIAVVIVWAVVSASGRSPAAYILKAEGDRQQFIRDMGWETSKEYSAVRTVTIPEEWSEVYESYNKLQKQQGFDLEAYKGHTVEVYTYPVYNYEGHTDKDCMQLTLMVCENKLIGGDVCCTELGGFMQGLKKSDK